MISVATYKLHITTTADTIVRGHPGFVPDEYLNSLGPAQRCPSWIASPPNLGSESTAATASAAGTRSA